MELKVEFEIIFADAVLQLQQMASITVMKRKIIVADCDDDEAIYLYVKVKGGGLCDRNIFTEFPNKYKKCCFWFNRTLMSELDVII